MNPETPEVSKSSTEEPRTEPKESGISALAKRFNAFAETYFSYLPSFYGNPSNLAYVPQIQNRRVKGIASLPCDYTKDDIDEFLRSPYQSEKPLRQTSQILKWTSYPYFKILKYYQDIPTYHYYSMPYGIEKQDVQRAEFKRETMLVDRFNKTLRPDVFAHQAVGEAAENGKVFYTPRYSVDKSHGKINYAFMQRLPQDWCTIVGYNNLSKYTVCFDMMYFLQPGTDVRQFGDLFEPYLEDFGKIFEEPTVKTRTVYSSLKANVGGRTIYPENANAGGFGNPRLKSRNGTWWYYVTLPADRVWTFEIDTSTPAVASPFSGLMPTFSQQSDFEAAQLTLLLSPLIKIFTGELEFSEDPSARTENQTKLSFGAQEMYKAMFNALMKQNNTGGTAFYMAPAKNIKSHDFPESANANDISESFIRYSVEKAGLSAIYPVTEDVKASQVDAATKIESRFTSSAIYPQVEKMVEHIYSSLNLRYEWHFKMFGSVFEDEHIRDNALKDIANGDISAHYVLSALNGQSLLEKLCMMNVVKDSGILDMLIPPLTSYTAKQENSNLPPQGGRTPTNDMSDAKEKYTDAYGV